MNSREPSPSFHRAASSLPNQSPLEYFGRALLTLGMENHEIVVLDPDVSASTKTTYFAERFPKRFINVGISEQDMIGIAAGLAMAGKTPIACGFAIFVAGRAWEQIANSVARPGLNVKIVATHSGLSAYADGNSHQSLWDIALMRLLPNMTVVIPADAFQAAQALKAVVQSFGPTYLRFGRSPTPTVYEEDSPFYLGKASLIREGEDVSIIANGVMVPVALKAADSLRGEGVDARVIDLHTVKPIDEGCIFEAAKETGAIVTAEEHSVIGGLGGAVSEVLSRTIPTPMRMVGVIDKFGESSRDYWSLLAKHGLTPEGVVDAVHKVLLMRR